MGLVPLKLWRVRYRLNPDYWHREMLFSVSAAVIVLVVLGTGIAWASGRRLWLDRWTLLTIHAVLGLALVPPLLLHLRLRFRPPRQVDFADRRTVLQMAVIGGSEWSPGDSSGHLRPSSMPYRGLPVRTRSTASRVMTSRPRAGSLTTRIRVVYQLNPGVNTGLLIDLVAIVSGIL